MNTLDHRLKPKKSNKHMIRIIIYSAIIVAVIIFWFILASKVKSIRAQNSNSSEKVIQEIEAKYQERLTKSDKSVYDLAMIGKNLVEANRISLGLVALLEATKRDPNYRDIYLYTAKVYFDIGEYNKALDLAQKTQDIDPLYPQTQLLMAKIYERLGNAELAKLCYDKAKDFERKNE